MKVIIIAGHTASGKSTVLDALCKDHGFVKLITTTTRDPRPNEVNGVDYHFISKDEFKKRIDNKEFLEHVFSKDNFYGSSLSEFSKDLNGLNPVLILDPVGTKEAVRILNDEGHEPVSVFIDESAATCIQRVLDRPADINEKKKRINDIQNVESGWSQYIEYDFKTKPNSTIQENCLDILNFIKKDEPTLIKVNKRKNKLKKI